MLLFHTEMFPRLVSGGGSMVLCSSVYGLGATSMLSAYITSKHALEGLKKSAGADLFQHNIRLNNLNPGFTPSEMTGPFIQGPFREGAINEMHPDGKMSEMGETSAVTAYLLSSDSQYVNGQSMALGGGMENNLMNPNTFRTQLGAAFAAMAAAVEEAPTKAPTDEAPTDVPDSQEAVPPMPPMPPTPPRVKAGISGVQNRTHGLSGPGYSSSVEESIYSTCLVLSEKMDSMQTQLNGLESSVEERMDMLNRNLNSVIIATATTDVPEPPLALRLYFSQNDIINRINEA